MILRNFPAPFIARVLLVFGYFPLYELTTISRSYGLVLFLVLLIVGLAQRRRAPDWVLVALIVLLASTHAFAIPVAAGIALALWGGPRFSSPSWSRPHRWPLVISGAGVVFAAGFVVWSAGEGQTLAESTTTFERIFGSLGLPIRATLALPRAINENLGSVVLVGLAIAGVLVTVLMLVLVRRSVSARTLWVVSTLGITVLGFSSARVTSPRFASVFWVAGLATVWFASVDRRTRQIPDRSPIPFAVKLTAAIVLLVSVLGGLRAAVRELRIPFSGSEAAARILASEIHGPAVILCLTTPRGCSAVAIRLDLPAYMRADGEPFTFVNPEINDLAAVPNDQVREEAEKLSRRTGAEVFIVSELSNALEGCSAQSRPKNAKWISITGEDYRVCPSSSLSGSAPGPAR